MNEIECPYCKAQFECCEDDEPWNDPDESYEMECDKCGKAFVLRVAIRYHCESRKADCLNGAPHKYGKWMSLWLIDGSKECQVRSCKDCGIDERRTIPKKDGGDA